MTGENFKQKRYFELYAGLAGSLSLLNILNNSDSSVKYAKSVSSSNVAAVRNNTPALECRQQKLLAEYLYVPSLPKRTCLAGRQRNY